MVVVGSDDELAATAVVDVGGYDGAELCAPLVFGHARLEVAYAVVVDVGQVGCGLLGPRCAFVVEVGPIVVGPLHLVETHDAPVVDVVLVVGMEEHPRLSALVLDDARVVSWGDESGVGLGDDVELIVHHRASVLRPVGSAKRRGPSDDGLVGASFAFAASVDGGKHVEVVAAFVDVGRLEAGAGQLELGVHVFHGQSVFGEFNAPDAVP